MELYATRVARMKEVGLDEMTATLVDSSDVDRDVECRDPLRGTLPFTNVDGLTGCAPPSGQPGRARRTCRNATTVTLGSGSIVLRRAATACLRTSWPGDQVIGEATLGPDEATKRIHRVDSICRVNVSPIEVGAFRSGTELVHARRPLTFHPAIHEGYEHFVLRDAPFGIHLLSATREELEANLLEELDTIWRHFACADDADLTPDAQELKRELHSAFSTA